MLDSILASNFLGIDKHGLVVIKNNQKYHYRFIKQSDSGICVTVPVKVKYICFENPFICEPDDGFVITRIVDENIIDTDNNGLSTTTIKLYSNDILLSIIDIECSDISEEVKDEDGCVDIDASYDQLEDIKNSWFIGAMCEETHHIDKIYTSIGYEYRHF